MREAVDVLIVGAGSIGSSLAMHLGEALRRMGSTRRSTIRVIDPDLEGSYSSSERNAGGVRATMSQPLNIALSKLSLDYFSMRKEEVGFREVGYLWLGNERMRASAERSIAEQKALDWQVELWDKARIQKERPFLDKCEGVDFAWFGKRDGLINPNLLKLHYRTQATNEGGVVFQDRTELKEIKRLGDEDDFEGFEVVLRTRRSPWTDEAREAYFSSRRGEGAEDWSEETIRARIIVNCAGPWASVVASRMGYASPVVPSRRQACLVETKGLDLTSYGMTVSPGGVYFHPEATFVVAGINEPETVPGFRFDFDGQIYFEEKIWPGLYELSTAFEELKLRSGWAGLYEISPDHSAIIGLASGRRSSSGAGLYECVGFSGHGIMQSYSAGLCLAELISEGRYRTLDLSAFSSTRFLAPNSSSGHAGRALVKEGWVI